ncbi:Protein of unknown function [Amphibacillus marinus]|uniref:Uncharacterized protein n=1 Tax=Amphibacillus marinus TaxID=872970 RepID=A0A1H8Q9P0_9BACI|nr:DUF3603 family protein [Amphibacillus marinus]SEO50644.1 Protein of unknown function [Amphibacillus marinus]
MNVIQDVWVNWFEGEANGYNICPFYEWRKLDDIELIDTIPVLYIESQFFTYIENQLDDLPKKLLDFIKGQTVIKGERIIYAAIVTDGLNVLAFDTMGYQMPLKKSRLIPRQERKVLRMVDGKQRQYFRLSDRLQENGNHIFSLAPEAMIGLMRRERELKQLTMLALDAIRQTKNKSEVHYWLMEWEPDQYLEICSLNFEQAWERLYNHVYHKWSQRHELFCRAIIKGNPLFEQLWEKAHLIKNQPALKRMK